MAELFEILPFVVAQTVRFLPWFLLAVALGALMQCMTLEPLARRAFSHGATGIILATSVGAFSPFCSFTVIPVIRGFLKAGVPLSVAMAFWFASPTMDPEIFALTAGILGIPIAMARLLAALAVSAGSGFVVLALERRGLIRNPLREEARAEAAVASVPAAAVGAQPAVAVGGPPVVAEPGVTSGCGAVEAPPSGGDCAAGAGSACGGTAVTVPDDIAWWRIALSDLRHLDVRRFVTTTVRDTFSLGRWLVLAFVLQAMIVFYVPQEIVLGTLGVGGFLSVPLAGLLGIPLYLNGVSAIPVVAGLLEQGMVPGAAVTFLIAGAVTTLPAIAAVRGVVNNRITGLYLLFGMVGSIGVGLLSIPFL